MPKAYIEFRKRIMDYNATVMERMNAYREEFNNRQKDISIGIHISRILSEMRFRARINHRATDFAVVDRDFKMTNNFNMVVFELLRYSENTRSRCFQVYAYWDRTQSSDVFLKVYRFRSDVENAIERDVDFEIRLEGMALLQSVSHDHSSLSAAASARTEIHNTFAKHDADVSAAMVS